MEQMNKKRKVEGGVGGNGREKRKRGKRGNEIESKKKWNDGIRKKRR